MYFWKPMALLQGIRGMRVLRLFVSRVLFPHQMLLNLRREALVLFIGDMCFLAFSLWATLLIRYAAFPDARTLYTHFVPFSFLFLLSGAVFLIAGLYEKHTLVIKSKLPQMVFYAQVANWFQLPAELGLNRKRTCSSTSFFRRYWCLRGVCIFSHWCLW